MYSSSGSGFENRNSGASLSKNNHTSSFGNLSRSNILGKHMSMQQSSRVQHSLHSNQPNNIESDYESSNKGYRMMHDSFGPNKRTRTSNQSSVMHEEAKIQVQLSTISES